MEGNAPNIVIAFVEKYKEVSLGKKEGEIMKELVYKHKLFVRKEHVDFQGKRHVFSRQTRADKIFFINIDEISGFDPINKP